MTAEPNTPTGNLFVVAAPSGGGKTSLVRELLKREPGIKLSVSFTTRISTARAIGDVAPTSVTGWSEAMST